MVVSFKKRRNREKNLRHREDDEFGFGCVDFAVTVGHSAGHFSRHWQPGTGASKWS